MSWQACRPMRPPKRGQKNSNPPSDFTTSPCIPKGVKSLCSAILPSRLGPVGEVAYVDQDPVIFKGTILQNLALFGGRAREDAARHMSQKIGLEEDILRMPLGYETEIGPGARTVLPLGTQQKICLARCLGLRPRVLLFNNAASAIDGKSITDVADALRALKGQVTILIAAPKLLEDADIDLEIDIDTSKPKARESASLRAWLDDAQADRAPIRLRPRLERAL